MMFSTCFDPGRRKRRSEDKKTVRDTLLTPWTQRTPRLKQKKKKSPHPPQRDVAASFFSSPKTPVARSYPRRLERVDKSRRGIFLASCHLCGGAALLTVNLALSLMRTPTAWRDFWPTAIFVWMLGFAETCRSNDLWPHYTMADTL